MPDLIHELIAHSAELRPTATALVHKNQSLTYAELEANVDAFAAGLMALGVARSDRVAVYLPKQLHTVFGLFGAARAGGCFVPLNPVLKARQLAHILPHSNTRVLLTSWDRLDQLREVLSGCPELHTLVLVDERPAQPPTDLPQALLDYDEFVAAGQPGAMHRCIDIDMAAILYTSGSTGNAKGVVLSHRNLVAGARSVAAYLENTAEDRLLSVLPLSFDAGLSQLTSAFAAGASIALMDYLLPRDVIRAAARHHVTGLAGVPPLWNQLRDLPWPQEVKNRLRYITNTGGAMPEATTRALQRALPDTDIYLMYGLTEAFRSTYLPPEEIDTRPDSIGKAIPNAEILVVNDEGVECAPGETGELVHRGALVSMGYWRDPKKTARHFRPPPARIAGLPTDELAVWSGDLVRKDEDGFLYFVGRRDDLIKTSGYRVSPTEVEEVALGHVAVQQAVALGLAHAELGQAILLLVCAAPECLDSDLETALMAQFRLELPNYMTPAAILCLEELPLNQNGKVDRSGLRATYHDFFEADAT